MINMMLFNPEIMKIMDTCARAQILSIYRQLISSLVCLGIRYPKNLCALCGSQKPAPCFRVFSVFRGSKTEP